MVFSSLSFIFIILPFFLCSDNLKIIQSRQLRNVPLFISSLIFYTWGESATVFLLLILSFLNFMAGKSLCKIKHSSLMLFIFIAINLLVLIGYKYFYWLSAMLLPGLINKQIAMPLGISFFTFHAISYLIDIYRKTIEPAANALDFFTYFCMFPHLVAGPIVRYSQVREDLATRGPTKELFTFGLYRFLIGLNKKVLIANSVAPLADATFNISMNHLSGLDAWIGILAYSIQIYFDFSGYSDMAIGLAAMAGFHFDENFRRPYSAKSMRDFWQRWHISLSRWLRDYLYLPLGGSRGGAIYTYRNLLIVFFVCGIWHGANWTFALWGFWHGAFLIIERIFSKGILGRLPSILGRGYVWLIVIIGWVFFRSDSIGHALQYLEHMFSMNDGKMTLLYYTLPSIALCIGMLLCVIPDKYLPMPTSRTENSFTICSYTFHATMAFLSVGILCIGSNNPFIYFNF